MPDCDRCGEGDLVHLRLEGERTPGREQAGRPHDGIVSALFETWMGAVEVEAAGITLALLTGLPRVLRMMASFKTSLAFLAAIKRWSVREIQVVKPQPGLCVSRGREPASEG